MTDAEFDRELNSLIPSTGVFAVQMRDYVGALRAGAVTRGERREHEKVLEGVRTALLPLRARVNVWVDSYDGAVFLPQDAKEATTMLRAIDGAVRSAP